MIEWFHDLRIKNKIKYPSFLVIILIIAFFSTIYFYFTYNLLAIESKKNTDAVISMMSHYIESNLNNEKFFNDKEKRRKTINQLLRPSEIRKPLNFVALFDNQSKLIYDQIIEKRNEKKYENIETKYKTLANSQKVNNRIITILDSKQIISSAPIIINKKFMGSLILNFSISELSNKKFYANLFFILGASVFLLFSLILLSRTADSIVTPVLQITDVTKLFSKDHMDDGIHYLRSSKWGNNEFGILREELTSLGSNINNKMIDLKKKIVHANESLEKATEDLTRKQIIHDKNMQMATNVQNNLFLKEPPQFKNWEVAFVYKPMEGVSGDLYDFYYEENELKGLSLCDVSGHGIASALITLISKSILHRIFFQYKHEKLTKVIQRINAELIEELENIDNYLTGVLLRFTDNFIEYVNAGHTDVFLRLKETGNTYPIKPQKGDFKGLYLGIEAMQSKFKMLTFKLNKGDSLLIYSDCLIESKNGKGDEFGTEGLLQCFKNVSYISSDPSAQEQLDYIVSELYKHIGGRGFDDDLTAILIKRLT